MAFIFVTFSPVSYLAFEGAATNEKEVTKIKQSVHYTQNMELGTLHSRIKNLSSDAYNISYKGTCHCSLVEQKGPSLDMEQHMD
jgi:hypothetical protein